MSTELRVERVLEVHSFCVVCGKHIVIVIPFDRSDNAFGELCGHLPVCVDHWHIVHGRLGMDLEVWERYEDASHQ